MTDIPVELVERAARAFCTASGGDPEQRYGYGPDEHAAWTEWVDDVTAALAAVADEIRVQAVAELPARTRETRLARGLSLRQAAAEIGMSFNTLTRFEHGRSIETRHLPNIFDWLRTEDVGK